MNRDKKLVTCRNGHKCRRGPHATLSQFTRAKATLAFTSGGVSGFVPEQALAALKKKAAGEFRSVTLGKN